MESLLDMPSSSNHEQNKAKKKKISGYFNIKYGFICMVCVTRTKAVKLHLKNKTII